MLLFDYYNDPKVPGHEYVNLLPASVLLSSWWIYVIIRMRDEEKITGTFMHTRWPGTFLVSGQPYRWATPFGIPVVDNIDGETMYVTVDGVYCLLGDQYAHFPASSQEVQTTRVHFLLRAALDLVLPNIGSAGLGHWLCEMWHLQPEAALYDHVYNHHR